LFDETQTSPATDKVVKEIVEYYKGLEDSGELAKAL